MAERQGKLSLQCRQINRQKNHMAKSQESIVKNLEIFFARKESEPLGQSSGSNSVRFFPQVAVQKLPEGIYPHQLPGGMCAILGSQVFLDERKNHMKEKACFLSFDVLS